MIQVITKKDDLLLFKDSWDALYNEIDYATPFQSYSFNYYSWKILERDKRLHIILIYCQKDKKLQAIFPCVIHKNGILHFINGIHSDFCGALIHNDFVKDYHLYKEFSEYIRNNQEIQGFVFDNLKEDNYLTGILGYLFKGAQTRITNRWSYLTFYKDKNDKEMFLSSMQQLSSKDRYRLKNIQKKSQNLKFQLFRVHESPYPKRIVEDIIDTMITSKIRTEAYFSEKFKALLENVYEEGLLTIGCSFEGENPIAANLYLINGKEYIDWLAIYKDGKYNISNLLQMMERIYINGGGTFNFARGLYDYKISNFRPEIHNLYRIEYSKSNKGQMMILKSFYWYYLKVFLKVILKRR